MRDANAVAGDASAQTRPEGGQPKPTREPFLERLKKRKPAVIDPQDIGAPMLREDDEPPDPTRPAGVPHNAAWEPDPADIIEAYDEPKPAKHDPLTCRLYGCFQCKAMGHRNPARGI